MITIYLSDSILNNDEVKPGQDFALEIDEVDINNPSAEPEEGEIAILKGKLILNGGVYELEEVRRIKKIIISDRENKYYKIKLEELKELPTPKTLH